MYSHISLVLQEKNSSVFKKLCYCPYELRYTRLNNIKEELHSDKTVHGNIKGGMGPLHIVTYTSTFKRKKQYNQVLFFSFQNVLLKSETQLVRTLTIKS